MTAGSSKCANNTSEETMLEGGVAFKALDEEFAALKQKTKASNEPCVNHGKVAESSVAAASSSTSTTAIPKAPVQSQPQTPIQGAVQLMLGDKMHGKAYPAVVASPSTEKRWPHFMSKLQKPAGDGTKLPNGNENVEFVKSTPKLRTSMSNKSTMSEVSKLFRKNSVSISHHF